MGRTGNSTPKKRKPFCKPCMKKGVRRHPSFKRRRGEGVEMECSCGHTYVTYSKTAIRIADHHDRAQKQNK